MLLKRRAEYDEHEERLARFVSTFYFSVPCARSPLFAPRYPLSFPRSPFPVPRFSNIPSGILQRHIFVEYCLVCDEVV